MKKTNISVIILSYNESIHIERVMNNVVDWADEVILFDSFSNDDTVHIVESKFNSVRVVQRKFDNYSSQRLASLNEAKNEWVLFLDADEILSKELKSEISSISFNSDLVQGYYLNRRFIFMNRWIRYGGYFPSWNMRLFSKKFVRIEREVNEFITVAGKTERLTGLFADHNLNDFSFWIDKHNRYSTREAIELSNSYDVKLGFDAHENKKWLRQRIWNKLLPPLIRPFVYFTWRYFVKLGFLDGRQGFIYHLFHAFVYRMIIDVKYLQNTK